MTTAFELKVIPYIRWTARIIGTLIIVFLLIMFIGALMIGEGTGGLVLSELELYHQLSFVAL
ncbi:MAG: hypothetical protein P9M15_05530 [Candidatus Electryoneaceae bacterium]|nr:hypothetical protein [Candidatus Electryoneaceae bacterium]